MSISNENPSGLNNPSSGDSISFGNAVRIAAEQRDRDIAEQNRVRLETARIQQEQTRIEEVEKQTNYSEKLRKIQMEAGTLVTAASRLAKVAAEQGIPGIGIMYTEKIDVPVRKGIIFKSTVLTEKTQNHTMTAWPLGKGQIIVTSAASGSTRSNRWQDSSEVTEWTICDYGWAGFVMSGAGVLHQIRTGTLVNDSMEGLDIAKYKNKWVSASISDPLTVDGFVQAAGGADIRSETDPSIQQLAFLRTSLVEFVVSNGLENAVQ